jgi:hypothetical protein
MIELSIETEMLYVVVCLVKFKIDFFFVNDIGLIPMFTDHVLKGLTYPLFAEFSDK